LSHKQLLYIETLLVENKMATASFRICEEAIISIENSRGDLVALGELPFDVIADVSNHVLAISAITEEDINTLSLSSKIHFDETFSSSNWQCNICQEKRLDTRRNCGYLDYKNNPKHFNESFKVHVGRDIYTHCPIFDINKDMLSDAIQSYNFYEAKFLPDEGGLFDQTRFFIMASQVIAELKGYDVHHFLDEYEAAEQLFKHAEKHYLSSKHLLKNKALKQSQWLEINKNYYEAKLRFEHLNHYRGFLTVSDDEKIAIIAPTAGYVRYANSSASKLEGELLFDIIPSEAIRLTTNVPLANIEQLSQLNVLNSDCVLNIASKETIASRFVTKIWSTAINESKQCQFTLGQSLVVTPIYQQNALTVNKKAVFEFEDKNYIALKNQQKLTLVSINILSSSANHYHFTANADLANKSALISSVSAVQGILLNLGDE